MDRTRLESLIQGELDGELPAAERAELAGVLLQDAEARRLRDDYGQLHGLLRGIAAAEPPSGLRQAILEGTAERPARNSGYRLAASFIGALMIAGLAYFAGYGRGSDTDLQGSMAAAPGAVSLRAAGIAVEASLQQDGDRHQLRIRASAPTPCEVVVRFDPGATTYTGNSGDGATTATEGRVTVRLPAGHPAQVLEFSGTAPSTLELHAGGRALGEARLTVSGS